MIAMPMTVQRWFALGALITVGAGTGAYLVSRAPASQPPAPSLALTPTVRSDLPTQDPIYEKRTKGPADAPITIYEMSDFQCPYCRSQALEVFPALEKEFIETGKLRWIFINLPLTSIHDNAAAAAEFAMCAAKADKFWPVHDLLFIHQAKWAPLKDPGQFLMSLADSVGLARESVGPCLESGEMRAIVQGEAEGASKSGVRSTPTIYIENEGLIPGAVPLAPLRAIIDSLWKDKTKKN